MVAAERRLLGLRLMSQGPLISRAGREATHLSVQRVPVIILQIQGAYIRSNAPGPGALTPVYPTRGIIQEAAPQTSLLWGFYLPLSGVS